LANAMQHLSAGEVLADARPTAVFSLIKPTASSPLPECWQFLYQTAAPPRAPSFSC
jgi:hypothetical protein